MSPALREVPFGITAETFLEGQHICYLVEEGAERTRTIGQFLDAGVSCGEKALYLVDHDSPAAVRDAFTASGVGADGRVGALAVETSESVYRPNGIFDPDAMVATVRGHYRSAIDEGFAGARGAGEMTWTLRGGVDFAAVFRYEEALTALLEDAPCTTVCVYDLASFDGAMIMEVLRTHPLTLIGGQVIRNPFFVPAPPPRASARTRPLAHA